MPYELMLCGGGINWTWYHKVLCDDETKELKELDSFRLHDTRDRLEQDKIECVGTLEVLNSISDEFRKSIGLGDGPIARIQSKSTVTIKYYRWVAK